MASVADAPRRPTGLPAPVVLLAVVVTAALGLVGTGLHPVWWLTWFLPLPMLLAAPSLRARTAFGAAWLGSTLGALAVGHYAVATIGAPAPLIAGFLAVNAAAFAAVICLWRAWLVRGRHGWALWSVPMAATAADHVQSLLSPHGVFLSPSVTQAGQHWLVPVVALSGIWVLTFLLYAVPAALATLVLRRPSGWAGWSGPALVVAIGIIAAVVGGLAVRPSAGPSTEVATVAVPVPGDSPPAVESGAGRRVLAAATDGVADAARRGARVVVLPEASVLFTDSTGLAAAERQLAEAAGPTTSVMFAHALRTKDGTEYNQAVLLAPGKAPVRYRKQHLVPGGEDSETPGTHNVTVRYGDQTWALAICKDLDFPGLTRDYGRDTADLLLVPAWDFKVDGWLHGRMGLLEAAANGIPMVRSVRGGEPIITDGSGRVLAETSDAGHGTEVLVASVPARGGETPYARFGPWLAWLSALGALGSVSGVILTHRRPRHGAPVPLGHDTEPGTKVLTPAAGSGS